MKLSAQQIRSVAFGALETEEDFVGLHFYRITRPCIKAWAAQSLALGERARATAGIRLDFHTDSQSLLLEAARGKKFEVYLNGERNRSFSAGETVELRLKDGTERDDTTRVTVYFPAHEHGVLANVELDTGASLIPHTFSRRMLFIGDSITQGWEAEHDSLSYANRVSNALDADRVIQGVGGSYYCRSCLGPIPYKPDTVIVAYGTNDFERCKDRTLLVTEVRACLRFLSEEYAQSRLYVILPIWRAAWKERVVSFDDCRAIIREEAERLGLHVVDGLALVPHDPTLFTDGLHPNDEGFAHYAENLLKYLG